MTLSLKVLICRRHVISKQPVALHNDPKRLIRIDLLVTSADQQETAEIANIAINDGTSFLMIPEFGFLQLF